MSSKWEHETQVVVVVPEINNSPGHACRPHEKPETPARSAEKISLHSLAVLPFTIRHLHVKAEGNIVNKFYFHLVPFPQPFNSDFVEGNAQSRHKNSSTPEVLMESTFYSHPSNGIQFPRISWKRQTLNQPTGCCWILLMWIHVLFSVKLTLVQGYFAPLSFNLGDFFLHSLIAAMCLVFSPFLFEATARTPCF